MEPGQVAVMLVLLVVMLAALWILVATSRPEPTPDDEALPRPATRPWWRFW